MSRPDEREMSEDTRRDLAEVMAALRAAKGGEAPAEGMDKFEAGVAKLPGRGEWVKAAPGIAMICGTLLIVTFVIVFTVLTVTGTPTDTFFRLVNLFLNALGAITTLTILVVAMMQARRTLENRQIAVRGQEEAHRAAEKATDAARAVNGDLERRILRAVGPALEAVAKRAADETAARVRAERDLQDCLEDDESGPPAG